MTDDLDAETEVLMDIWLNQDGSALPLIRRLIEQDDRDRAATYARGALMAEDCKDRDELEEALLEAIDAPAGWVAGLEEFAKNPSIERWNELMTFVPEDREYQCIRATVRHLMRLGCDGNILFRCITQSAFTPDVFDLAESGTVDPEVILARGEGSPARAMWLGLAARAAWARGDRWNTLKWLREAAKEDAFFSYGSIREIRDRADAAFNEELDRLGLPRQFPSEA